MCVHQLNKGTTLMRDVNDGGDYAYVGQELCGKYLYIPLNFAVSLKLLVKQSLNKTQNPSFNLHSPGATVLFLCSPSQYNCFVTFIMKNIKYT